MNHALKTLYNIKLFDKNGILKEERNESNYITDEGLQLALDFLFLNKSSFAAYYPKYATNKKNDVTFYVGLIKTFPNPSPTQLSEILYYTTGTSFDVDNEFLEYKATVVNVESNSVTNHEERSELYITQRSKLDTVNKISNYSTLNGSIFDTRRSFAMQNADPVDINGLFLTNKKEHPEPIMGGQQLVGYDYTISQSEKLYGVVEFVDPITVVQDDVLYITATLSASSA